MKRIFILIVVCCFGGYLYAQNAISVNNGIKCGIWYDYDKAGNRVKRYYDCKDPRLDTEPWHGDQHLEPNPTIPYDGPIASDHAYKGATGQKVTIYPNPVLSEFNISIPKSTAKTHFHMYDAKGSIITSGEIIGERYKGQMGNLPAGSYMIVVYYNRATYNFAIIKQ